jgi:hypothetical protein
MRFIKNIQDLQENRNYEKPETFENVSGIDISLTPMRKLLKIKVGAEEVDLSKADAEKILFAIEKAIEIMP